MREGEISSIWICICFILKLYGNLEVYMPKVGKRHFSYTKKGKAAAKKLAKKTGKKVKKMKKGY